jgi:hypothetical protein
VYDQNTNPKFFKNKVSMPSGIKKTQQPFPSFTPEVAQTVFPTGMMNSESDREERVYATGIKATL